MSFQSLEDAVFNGGPRDAARYVMQSGNPNELFNDRNGTFVSLLHYFVMLKITPGVEGLLSLDADPNIRASDGLAPLTMAVINNDPDIIRVLVKGGADINVREPRNGDTPLSAALLGGKHESAEALMALGANPDIPNNKGITARQISSFQVMEAGGWDPSRPNFGSSLFDNLSGMSEEGLIGFCNLLPLMLKSSLDSGKMTPQRGAMLNSFLHEFKQAIQLPLKIRVIRMKEICAKLQASMGTSQINR